MIRGKRKGICWVGFNQNGLAVSERVKGGGKESWLICCISYVGWDEDADFDIEVLLCAYHQNVTTPLSSIINETMMPSFLTSTHFWPTF